MVNITHVDVLGLAASIPYANELTALANASTDHVSFISYSDEFLNGVLGNNVTQQLVADMSYDAFHEAGVSTSRRDCYTPPATGPAPSTTPST